jgi:hypothetical protein
VPRERLPGHVLASCSKGSRWALLSLRLPRPAALVVGIVTILTAAWPAGAAPRTVAAADSTFAREALRVLPGEAFVVEGVWLERDTAPVALELERVEIWAPGGVVEIDGRVRPAPASAVFRGGVLGVLGSIAVVIVAENGESEGLVLRDGEGWVLGRERGGAGGLTARRAEMGALDKPFTCGNEDPRFRGIAALAAAADEPAPSFDDPAVAFDEPATATSSPSAPSAASHTTVPYTATLALETDAEYYARFSSKADPQAAALDYLALLIAYADVVYSREIDTTMRIGYARLWTGGTGSDPWTKTDVVDAMLELQSYWNAHMTHVERTTAHFVSGKNLGGGVAYLGTMCGNYSTPGASNDYGLSASIAGNFSWNGDPSANPSAVVWDVIVVLHELGHNFNSEHSHDYCGIGGSTQAIDRCYASQKCGTAATGLPSCSSPTPHFSGGAGTIMSYCHFQTGGYGNIAMTFGEDHTCGDLPWRQADLMSGYVANRAASVPACFAGGGTSASCPADIYEGVGAGGTDDTCYGAQIALGVGQPRTLCDEDWAWFEPLPGATYRIETSALVGGADTTLALHRDCGSQLAFNDDYAAGSAASRIDWTATDDVAIDLRVRSAGAYGSDDGYTLSVTCIANCGGGCPTNLTLTSSTVNSREIFKAESTITAGSGFTVGSQGDVTLHAGGSVALGDGFSVASGGTLRVVAGVTPSCY